MSAAGDSVTLETGIRARIRNLQITGADSLQVATFREAAGFKEDGGYRPGEWPAQCARGLDKLGEGGHPFASVTILDLQEDRDSGQVDLSLFLNTGAPARIGKVENPTEVSTPVPSF